MQTEQECKVSFCQRELDVWGQGFERQDKAVRQMAAKLARKCRLRAHNLKRHGHPKMASDVYREAAKMIVDFVGWKVPNRIVEERRRKRLPW